MDVLIGNEIGDAFAIFDGANFFRQKVCHLITSKFSIIWIAEQKEEWMWKLPVNYFKMKKKRKMTRRHCAWFSLSETLYKCYIFFAWGQIAT